MKYLSPVILCLLAAVPLLAAGTSVLPPPVAVVYPLTVSGPANADAGSRLAVIFAEGIATRGGVDVKPATPGITRAGFLDAARAQGADYYVSGYLTPLGDEVSLLIQVVSTYSGTVVWSTTTQVRTYNEAAGQADIISDAILRHAGRSLAALEAPPPVPTNTPAPPSNGRNEANLSRIFSRPKPTAAPPPPPKATATPAPNASAMVAQAPAASPAPAPTPAAIVVPISSHGATQTSQRNYANTALSQALVKAGLGGAVIATGVSASDLPAKAQTICDQNHVTAIYTGSIGVSEIGTMLYHEATADFALVRYNCTGAVTANGSAKTKQSGKFDVNVAIDHAIAQALDQALNPPSPTPAPATKP